VLEVLAGELADELRAALEAQRRDRLSADERRLLAFLSRG
jgi:hypothetical protein